MVRLVSITGLLLIMNSVKVLIVSTVSSPKVDLKVTVSISLWPRLAVVVWCALNSTVKIVTVSVI